MSRPSLRRIGLVVHPVRDVTGPLEAMRAWSEPRGVELVQIAVSDTSREIAPAGVTGECDMVVAIGGDGTMLAAVRAAMPARRPVLGIACGSLGVLARVAPAQIGPALDRVAAGDWRAESLPGLAVQRSDAPELLALNDLSVVRAGIGQIRVIVEIDGTVYGRVAGDGIVVATALGSSAYSLAAGGPLLGGDVDGLVITPLPTHGGAVPPLVVGSATRVGLQVDGGYGGARLELDGQIVTGAPRRLELTLVPAVAELVALAGQPPSLSVLRDRGIVQDSPRIVADPTHGGEDARMSDS